MLSLNATVLQRCCDRELRRVRGIGFLLGWLTAAVCACGGGGGGGNPPAQNEPPTARILAGPITGNAPLAVSFSAVGSSDADGNITRFQWDFDGDTFLDLDTTAAQATHLYTEAGTFTILLQVVDDRSAADTEIITVNVTAPAYQTTTIDPAPHQNLSLSAAIIAGNPAVCRCGTDTGGLQYYRASNSSGTAWSAPVVIDPGNIEFVTLAEVSGNPAVLYRRPADSLLLYLRANDSQGQSWPSPADAVIASPDEIVTSGVRLLVPDGNPMAIIGLVTGPFEVTLLKIGSEDPLGAAWFFFSETITVVNDSAGVYASAVVGGRPAIALGERSGGSTDIQYIQALDAAGTQWPADTTAVADGIDSFSPQFFLTEVNGRPNIAGNFTPTGALGPGADVFQAADAAGTSWTRNLQMPQFADEVVMDFGVVAGFPLLVMDTTSDESIRLLLADDAQGSNFNGQLIAAPEDGFPAALLEVNDRPAVAYLQEATGALLFAGGS